MAGAAGAAGARAAFRQRFAREPELVASAPGRVNLIGEHVDYNGGAVLPIAIERRTWVAAGFRRDGSRGTVRAVSTSEPGEGEGSLVDATPTGKWWDYVVGVAAPLLAARLDAGAAGPPSLDVAVHGDLGTGAGLSSSAALEVATSYAVRAMLGASLAPLESAMDGWRAECGFVGVSCGIMDQFACALSREGEALHLDCSSATWDFVPFTDSVLIFDTGVRRSLRDSAFNERRAECAEALRLLRERWPDLPSLAAATPEQVSAAALPPPLDRRALHVTRETRRVDEAAALLRAGRPLTRELLIASHLSLRELFKCSTAELDWVVERAFAEPGVRGARLTGAGWGGCAIAVGDRRSLEAVGEGLAEKYRTRFKLEPKYMVSGAAAGVRIESGHAAE
jgi:galactokinase